MVRRHHGLCRAGGMGVDVDRRRRRVGGIARARRTRRKARLSRPGRARRREPGCRTRSRSGTRGERLAIAPRSRARRDDPKPGAHVVHERSSRHPWRALFVSGRSWVASGRPNVRCARGELGRNASRVRSFIASAGIAAARRKTERRRLVGLRSQSRARCPAIS